MCKVSRPTLYKLTREGILKGHFRVGAKVFYEKRALIASFNALAS